MTNAKLLETRKKAKSRKPHFVVSDMASLETAIEEIAKLGQS